MSNFLINYFFILSVAGFIVLFILSVLSFVNVEALKIENDKHLNSGIILLITSIVYLAIALWIYFSKMRKTQEDINREQGYM